MKKILIVIFLLFSGLAYGQLVKINVGTGATNSGETLKTAFPKVNLTIDTVNVHTTQIQLRLKKTDAVANYVAKLNSILTGVPVAPTAAVGTNTNQIATTAFVNYYRRLNNHDSLSTLEEKGYASLSGKPTLGTAAAQDVGYFATAAQGTDARTPTSHAHGSITNGGLIGSGNTR